MRSAVAEEGAILESVRFEVSTAHRDLAAGLDPFVLGPGDHARIGYGALDPDLSYAVAVRALRDLRRLGRR